jgi:hypothetical protein
MVIVLSATNHWARDTKHRAHTVMHIEHTYSRYNTYSIVQ